jgi:hypothetical protein
MFVWKLSYLTFPCDGLPDHALHPNWRTSTSVWCLLCHTRICNHPQIGVNKKEVTRKRQFGRPIKRNCGSKLGRTELTQNLYIWGSHSFICGMWIDAACRQRRFGVTSSLYISEFPITLVLTEDGFSLIMLPPYTFKYGRLSTAVTVKLHVRARA